MSTEDRDALIDLAGRLNVMEERYRLLVHKAPRSNYKLALGYERVRMKIVRFREGLVDLAQAIANEEKEKVEHE